MGVVYLANDPEIGRAVAIKTVRPEVGRGDNAAQVEARFLKEAKLAGRLQHPNIVTVYDVGRDGESYFIAMEYVDGRPLTDYLAASDALPLAGKIGIIRQVAEALAHAHERGVLHRDIKPGNILIARDGQVKVTDFGIGKFTTAATSEMTRTGLIVGSPAYMSPEQVKGEKLDGRSDLFALGVVLYELLTGTRPFPGDSITTLVYQILHTEPRDPLELKADLPVATREVMARLLAKQPDKRPPDAKEFIRELKRIEKIQRESEVTHRMTLTAPGQESATLAATPAAAAPAAPRSRPSRSPPRRHRRRRRPRPGPRSAGAAPLPGSSRPRPSCWRESWCCGNGGRARPLPRHRPRWSRCRRWSSRWRLPYPRPPGSQTIRSRPPRSWSCRRPGRARPSMRPSVRRGLRRRSVRSRPPPRAAPSRRPRALLPKSRAGPRTKTRRAIPLPIPIGSTRPTRRAAACASLRAPTRRASRSTGAWWAPPTTGTTAAAAAPSSSRSRARTRS